jgi:hypothetical protein
MKDKWHKIDKETTYPILTSGITIFLIGAISIVLNYKSNSPFEWVLYIAMMLYGGYLLLGLFK